jgi:ferredoxin
MSRLACELQDSHCLFATSKTFSNVFLLELSYWTEGMPEADYRKLLRRFRLPDLPPPDGVQEVIRTVKQDLGGQGRLGLATVEQAGAITELPVDGCIGCSLCIQKCPTQALALERNELFSISLAHDLCNGIACRICEPICPEDVFVLIAFFRKEAEEKASPWQ